MSRATIPSPAARRRSLRPGKVDPAIFTMAVLFAMGGLVGAWWLWGPGGEEADVRSLAHEVDLDDFLLEITERGDLESSDVVEIRCEVKANNTQGTSILRLIPEGSAVEQGDFIMQLDGSALETARTNQQILVFTAESLRIEAQNAHELAQIAKEEYEEGAFVQEQQTIESEIFVAEENLSRSKEYLKYSERLAAKGHITEYQLEADRFAVEKAQKDLDVAETKLDVLRRFTRTKMLKQLTSDIATTKAKWDAEKNSYELELNKLKEIEDQITKCTITAPADGTVVYAHDREGRGEDFIIEEGAIVREGQELVRLPNQALMEVEVKINESLVKYVEPGQPAAILPVGFDKPLRGTVVRVNQYSEPSNWRKPDVREYAAFVRVDEASPNLRSGMTAQVTVQCAYLPEVLQVPVQTVYAHGKKFYCFVQEASGWEAREIKRGATNDKFFIVEGGLERGERVALAPRQLLDEVDLPTLETEKRQTVVTTVPLADSQRAVRAPLTRRPAESGQGTPANPESLELDQLLAQFDTDQDGKAALADLPAEIRSQAIGWDRNTDGQLDADELAAASAASADALGQTQQAPEGGNSAAAGGGE